MRAAAEEGPCEAPEDAAAEGLLAGEAAKERVDQVGAEIAVEATALLRGRRLEDLGSDEVGNQRAHFHRRRRIHESTRVVN